MMLFRSSDRQQKDKYQLLLKTLERMFNVDDAGVAIATCLQQFIDPMPQKEGEYPLPPIGDYKWRLKFCKVTEDGRGYYIMHSPACLRIGHRSLLRGWVKMLPEAVRKEAEGKVKELLEPLKTLLLFHIAYNIAIRDGLLSASQSSLSLQ